MKIGRIAMLVLAALVVAGLGTTIPAQVHSEIALSRAEIQAERQAIVAENLPLTEEQAKAFWPMYRDYRAAVAKQGDRLVALLENYAKNYDTMTDAQAQSTMDDFFAIQKDEVKIKSEWVSKFGKVLPATSVMRFFQLENKLDTIIRLELAALIPLVEHKPAAK